MRMSSSNIFLIILLATIIAIGMIACSAPSSAPDAPKTLLEQDIQQPKPSMASIIGTAQPTSLPISPTPTRVDMPPAILENRLLVLEWPSVIRMGDGDVIQLKLLVDQSGKLTPTTTYPGHEIQGQSVFIPNLFDTHSVMAEARLDLAGVDILPAAEMAEPMLPGSETLFVWSVSPKEIGVFRGAVWLHMRFIPLTGGDPQRKLISAQLIEIRSVNFLGLGGKSARLLGGLGTFLGSLLSLDQVTPWMKKLIRKRKTSKEGHLPNVNH